MKYIKEYIEETCFLHPMGEVTLQQNEDLAGWSGVNVCVNGVETPLFIAHADYAEWLESKLDNLKDKKDEKPAEKTEEKSEQKPEPRFKVGDWVVQGKDVCKIKQVTNMGNNFQYWTTDGLWFGDGTNAHLWTINDAKVGDVLAIGDEYFKRFLMKREAGYEWDADKKEAKRNEQRPLEQSEDERVRKELLEYLQRFVNNNPLTEETEKKMKDSIAWLEKLGECKPTTDIPTREAILSIWDLGNLWKALTNGNISTEHGTQIDYIQKHWHDK